MPTKAEALPLPRQQTCSSSASCQKPNSNLPELKGQNSRGGREERIKEGEKQQGQEGPWDPPPELSTVAPEESQLQK